MSLAHEASVDMRRQAAATPSYYNIKLGPTYWTVTGGLGVEYNDNINYQQVNPEADLILRPQLSASMVSTLSEKNKLSFTVGLGYSKYVQHSDLDRFFLTPGSEVSLDFFVKDWVINLHDRFAIREDNYHSPTRTISGKYSHLENAAGVTADWYGDKMVATLGFDHGNFLSLDQLLQTGNGRDEVAYARVGLPVHQKSLAGVEAGIGQIVYDDPQVRDAMQYNAGLFYNASLTAYLNVNARVGYTIYSPENGGTIGPPKEEDGFYSQLTLTHRVNQFMSHSLLGGRKTTIGMQWGGTDLYDYYFVYWYPIFTFIHDLEVRPAVFYENGQSFGSSPEHFNRVGLELNLSRPITRKLTAGLGYRFLLRHSDRTSAGYNYTANSVFVNVAYRF